MLDSPESNVGLPFHLYDYDGWPPARELEELIEDGTLPHDTFFRLAGVPNRLTDPLDESDYPSLLTANLIHDMLANYDNPDAMRADTRNVLWGELPDALVDPNLFRGNEDVYKQVDPLYYTMTDLAQIIKEKREEASRSIPEMGFEKRSQTVQDEWSRCVGIARPIWRTIVQRKHPEWLEDPSPYYPSSYIGHFCVVYEIGPKRMKRGVVTCAVLSDPLVHDVYEEVVATKVKGGIGKGGQESLRRLLMDEHPELMEGHEIPK